MTKALETPLMVEKRSDLIAIVTINRPEACNAINGDIAQSLEAAVDEIEHDPTIRVAILTGAGGKIFSAGADLKAVAGGNVSALLTESNGFAGFVYAQRAKPWIAAVDGLALGGGCELALACDMIVASDNGAFGLPEVSRGVIASAGGLYRMPRALPQAVAIELILTGARLSSQRAADLGMVNRLAPAGHVLEAALDLAASIVANAPVAVRESLQIARLAQELDDSSLRELSEAAQDRIINSEDFREGPRAFVEKRAPIWTGR